MRTNEIANIQFMGMNIQQDMGSGLLNIQPVLDWVNQGRKMGGEKNKRLHDYFASEQGQDYLKSVLRNMEKLSTTNELSFTAKEVGMDIESYTKFSMADLKAFEVYKDTRKTKNKEAGAWFSPLLALELMGWLSAKIRLELNKLLLQGKYVEELQALFDSLLSKPVHTKTKTTYTYVLFNEFTALCKIGRTTNLKRRYKSLCNMGGVKLTKAIIIQGDVEAHLHGIFKEKRKIGEWFDLTTQDIQIINKFYHTSSFESELTKETI